MENVDIIRHEKGQFLLRDIFGEEKSVKAKFIETHLLKHRIVLEEIP
jgi:predicted RNA-binding protein